MNLWAVLRVTWRRWYVFLPLLALTLAAAVTIPKTSAPTYTVQSTVLVQPPLQSHDTDPATGKTTTRTLNPLTLNRGDMTPVAQSLERIMATPHVAQALVDSHFDGGFSVAQTSNNEPVLRVLSTDKDESAALKASQKLFDVMTAELDQRQKPFLDDPTQRITLAFITQPEVTDIARVSKWRIGAAIIAAGLLFALLISVLADAALQGRSRRRPGRATVVAPEVKVHS